MQCYGPWVLQWIAQAHQFCGELQSSKPRKGCIASHIWTTGLHSPTMILPEDSYDEQRSA